MCKQQKDYCMSCSEVSTNLASHFRGARLNSGSETRSWLRSPVPFLISARYMLQYTTITVSGNIPVNFSQHYI